MPNYKGNFKLQLKKETLRNSCFGFNIDKNDQAAKFVLDENGGWDLCTL